MNETTINPCMCIVITNRPAFVGREQSVQVCIRVVVDLTTIPSSEGSALRDPLIHLTKKGGA